MIAPLRDEKEGPCSDLGAESSPRLEEADSIELLAEEQDDDWLDERLEALQKQLDNILETVEDLLKPRDSPARATFSELTKAQRDVLLRWPE